MKNLTFVCLSILFLFSCQEGAQKSPEAEAFLKDSTEIANTIHGFYKWYDAYVHDSTKEVDFVKVMDGHYALDLPLLEKYLANIKSSGFVSSELLDKDMAFYKTCEKLWQNEEADGPPIGMDADKYFCAQDWDINFWTQAPVRIKSMGDDKMAASLHGTQGGSPHEQNFELKKENGKWLLADIACDMGLSESTSSGSDQAQVEQLAAFYTGNLPCPDCDGVETVLTLNADEKRTFSLEEQHKGKRKDKVDTNGTWTVAGGIVTLKLGSGESNSFKVTDEGLISLNKDGSERDSKSANKYLLKKVQGE
jgi:NlpE N-terminal domain/Protein of unknown function (DUF3828)